MPYLNMHGPYPFKNDELETRISPGRIGNYAYGYFVFKKLPNGGLTRIDYVEYVGRSDTDLRERIKHGLAEKGRNGCNYDVFWFSYADSVEEAFEKECNNYHDFGGPEGYLKNKIHPDSPVGLYLDCPICG